jgi:hypothetical protein
MNTDAPRTQASLLASLSLARLLHDYGDRWEIERVERNTEWIAVPRQADADYIRIIGGRDLAALRYNIDQIERDEAQEFPGRPRPPALANDDARYRAASDCLVPPDD